MVWNWYTCTQMFNHTNTYWFGGIEIHYESNMQNVDESWRLSVVISHIAEIFLILRRNGSTQSSSGHDSNKWYSKTSIILFMHCIFVTFQSNLIIIIWIRNDLEQVMQLHKLLLFIIQDPQDNTWKWCMTCIRLAQPLL